MTDTSLQEVYRSNSSQVRGAFGGDVERAGQYYQRYIRFVDAFVPCRAARILDVGCGNGWSTWLLRRAGHEARGLDLHQRPLECQQLDPELPYIVGDAQELPFPDATFDAVCMYQLLEHVADPERALRESLRVLRSGGRLIVVGPHLLSVGVALRCVLQATARCLVGKSAWRRTSHTPRHPFGNTVPEVWWHLGHHFWATVRKSCGERPIRFKKRQPDESPPFHADNDACYWCNPMDLVGWACQTQGVRLVRWWALDRPVARVFWVVAGGTWFVAEKT